MKMKKMRRGGGGGEGGDEEEGKEEAKFFNFHIEKEKTTNSSKVKFLT